MGRGEGRKRDIGASMIKALEGGGFEPIPCSFLHYARFGGPLHCATLDVRRSGVLRSYF